MSNASFLFAWIQEGASGWIGKDGKAMSADVFSMHYAFEMIFAGNWKLVPNLEAEKTIRDLATPDLTVAEIVTKNQYGVYQHVSSPELQIIVGYDKKNENADRRIFIFSNRGSLESLKEIAWRSGDSKFRLFSTEKRGFHLDYR